MKKKDVHVVMQALNVKQVMLSIASVTVLSLMQRLKRLFNRNTAIAFAAVACYSCNKRISAFKRNQIVIKTAKLFL